MDGKTKLVDNRRMATHQISNNDSPAEVSFYQALLFWLKLGFISFGGPAGQIAIMHEELVVRKRWISEKRFLHALNFCMVLPGPEAQQLATYIGWLMHKTRGGVLAGVLFVLPSLFLLIALSWVYMAWGEVPWVAGIFYGIKPAVTAIVFQASHRIGSRALKNNLLWSIAGLSFVAIFVFNVPFPVIVISAAVLGYFLGRYAPHLFQSSSGHTSTSANKQSAWIDDDTPTPAHALFKWTRLIQVFAAGLLLWAIPMLWLFFIYGWDHTLTQMSWFFTKAALLTFGGAYAVLPYVYQGAVNDFSWLSATQMIDGLALGETTPGPLIMVVAFVAFVGGYAKAFFGADAIFLAGTIAACFVTWFTFLPSFIFILAGGPFIESTHQQIKLTTTLTAITAAVVGVVLNLALFFGYYVLWPQGLTGQFDWISLILALTSAVALFKYKANVIHVIVVSATIGVALTYLH